MSGTSGKGKPPITVAFLPGTSSPGALLSFRQPAMTKATCYARLNQRQRQPQPGPVGQVHLVADL
ncbi:hypothetical protein CBOM_04862 [Ceraceosorus bombacis]|uniref:Uncharacterized protein n=1 Tax=Ceraceosorus bombacis TaxID=401625 RepID=A0A0P1BNK5_9BASI|nr:hypothetical protein CBOM_04862 [Ceraceosorus bombacis]